MINVLLCSYNNYYNRIVKKLDTVDAYRAAAAPLFIDLENVNFNPGDGVTTDLIVGKGTGLFLNWDQGGPDYCIVYEKVNNVETIKSRWFILDENRTRGGQYKISLRRDVLADNINNIMSAPVYVDKGFLDDINSPFLCNNEEITVNQIKNNDNVLVNGEHLSPEELTKEVLLNDKSACPWLVLYLKKGVLGSNTTVTINTGDSAEYIYEELLTPITQWRYYDNQTTPYKVATKYTFITKYENGITYQYKVDSSKQSSVNGLSVYTEGRVNITTSASKATVKSNLNTQYLNNSKFNALRTLTNTAFGYNSSDGLSAYNGKMIKDSQGKVFKVTLSSVNTSTTHKVTSSAAPNVKTYMTTLWNDGMDQQALPNDNCFKATVDYNSITVVLEEQSGIETTIDFSHYYGKGTEDSPLFDAICMPYGEITEFIGTEVSTEFTTSRDRCMKIMNTIATALTSEKVLDFQLLPYCPVPGVLNDYYDEEGKIAVLDYMIDKLTLFCYNISGNTDLILVADAANVTFDINKSIEIADDSDVPSVFKTKYLNDCIKLRLCSPNYNGLFEINLAKNGGKINKFNVDLTLRPFNPYIHVNPDFNFLYGYDFDDVRGLICGGDFSLGILNDAWNVYEIQNKNYQAIFDRQIQNMDVNNAINRQEAMIGASLGTVRGAVEGGIAGGTIGGGYGAIAGAVVGGVSSGVGGILDVQNLEKRQQEQMSYASDEFNLRLGNVRALPNSITKTSALTLNNKKIPFIEVYECSPEEKAAYYNKLRYNGMTLGIVSTIEEFIGNDMMFKGRILRCDTINVDNHILNEINNELQKGVYL